MLLATCSPVSSTILDTTGGVGYMVYAQWRSCKLVKRLLNDTISCQQVLVAENNEELLLSGKEYGVANSMVRLQMKVVDHLPNLKVHKIGKSSQRCISHYSKQSTRDHRLPDSSADTLVHKPHKHMLVLHIRIEPPLSIAVGKKLMIV